MTSKTPTKSASASDSIESPSQLLWSSLRPELFKINSNANGNPKDTSYVDAIPRSKLEQVSSFCDRAATKLGAMVSPKSITTEDDFKFTLGALIKEFEKSYVLISGTLVAVVNQANRESELNSKSDSSNLACTTTFRKEIYTYGDELARHYASCERIVLSNDPLQIKNLAKEVGKLCVVINKFPNISRSDAMAVRKEICKKVKQVRDVVREFEADDEDEDENGHSNASTKDKLNLDAEEKKANAKLLNDKFGNLINLLEKSMMLFVRHLQASKKENNSNSGPGSSSSSLSVTVLESVLESVQKICDLIDDVAVCLTDDSEEEYDLDDFHDFGAKGSSDSNDDDDDDEMDVEGKEDDTEESLSNLRTTPNTIKPTTSEESNESRSLALYEGLQKIESLRRELICGVFGDVTKEVCKSVSASAGSDSSDESAKEIFRNIDNSIDELVRVVDLMASKVGC